MRCFNWVFVVLMGAIIAASAERAMAAPLPNDPNLVMWMRADNGVTGTSPVTAIADSSVNGNNLIGVGAPQLTSRAFATGPHSVIRFNGSSYFYVSNSIPFDLPNASIYIVGTQQNGNFTSQSYVANYGPSFSGYAVGISDSVAHRVKFYTSHGSGQSSLEPFTVADETPFMLTGTFDSVNNKDLYLNGGSAFHDGADAHPTYGITNQFSIGALDIDGNATPGTGYIQGIVGDIAEILIYKNVNAAQQADVQAYLNNKYFAAVPEPSTIAISFVGLAGFTFCGRRRAAGRGRS
jgi:hypothetical protein